MIPIDRNIAIPRPIAGVYPWHQLEVGDSFEVPAKDWAGTQSVRTCCSAMCKKYAPKKWQTKRTPVGIRVWRVS
jgi:hypothetical protein